MCVCFFLFFFFFNDTATTEIYTLSLHDALPISRKLIREFWGSGQPESIEVTEPRLWNDHISAARYGEDEARYLGAVYEQYKDRKSTRLNSSHANISYAVFCLKKKKIK